MAVSTKQLNDLLDRYKGDRSRFIKEYKQLDNTASESDIGRLWDSANPKSNEPTTPTGSGMDNTGQMIGSMIDAASLKNSNLSAGENIGIKGLYEVAIDKSTGKLNTFSQMVDNVGKGIQNSIYTVLEQQSSLHSEINTKLGMTNQLSEDFRGEITDAYPNAVRLGYSFNELEETMVRLIDNAGTFRLVNSETINSMTETGRVFFNRLDDTADAVKAFQDVSLGANDAMKAIAQAGKGSLELGLNSKTTTATLVQNIDKLNQFGFKNGVQGLNSMVQKAQQLKMDMQSVYTLAEKVMDPENALSMAAGLQAIGGAMGSFSDPIKMMYDSTNNVEDLQDALIGAAESLATYNSEQGRFEVTGANLRKAQAMAKELGISYSELTKLSVQAAQRSSAAADLMAAGLTFNNDEDKEFLTNLAQMKDGKMVIEVPKNLQEAMGGTTVALESLSEKQKETLLTYREQFKKMSMEDIATQQVGLVENINRDVNFIAAAARLQMGKSGKAVVDALGFDPMEVAKKSREASKAAAEGINSLGNAVTSTINDVTNVEGRKKAQSQTEPQKTIPVAEAERKAKEEAEKAKTQTSNNQSGQKNVNLKVTTDVSGDEFTRLIMKNPDMAGKFFDSWDSYTSVPQ
jgi:hypothetical protein